MWNECYILKNELKASRQLMAWVAEHPQKIILNHWLTTLFFSERSLQIWQPLVMANFVANPISWSLWSKVWQFVILFSTLRIVPIAGLGNNTSQCLHDKVFFTPISWIEFVPNDSLNAFLLQIIVLEYCQNTWIQFFYCSQIAIWQKCKN